MMSKRSRISVEAKARVVKRCLRNETNPSYEAKRLGISRSTIVDWMRKYELDGYSGLKESRGWKAYSEELKFAAIQDVLVRNCSIREVIKKYNISDKSVLRDWISKYTCGEELKPTRKGKGLSRMNKGRKTTFEERIEIVQYTIANDLNYQKSIDKYSISYQQVYLWVRKYKSDGEEALRDNRGRNKPAEALDDHERLKLRIKELEARNEYLEMENAFAKKLEEIQRRNTH